MPVILTTHCPECGGHVATTYATVADLPKGFNTPDPLCDYCSEDN